MKVRELVKRSIWKGLLLVFVAALILAATSLIQYYSSRKGLEEEASKRAETQLRASRNKIMDVINQAEAALRNSVWIAQWCLDYPDSIPRVCERIVNDNPVIVGSTCALVPGHLRSRPLYSPYVYRDGDTLSFRSLATEEYDYPSKEWFIKPLEINGDYWSEPYIDTGGGEMVMTTYSVPIRDKKGKVAAILTGDISLDWLTDLLENIKVYPHAYSMMISRTGRFLVSEMKDFVIQDAIDEVAGQIVDDLDFKKLTQAMLAGESGSLQTDYNGDKSYVFYAPVERTGWSMCVIIPEDDIYGGIRRIERMVRLLQIVGLLMLTLIILSLVRSQINYRKLDENKERMEGELRVARNIQMSMIPKVFPPFPERHDLDLSAVVVPAREVGGDLYDFYIRDEKLFFSVGDVSGKGVPASLVMAVTRSIFRSVSSREDSPGRILTSMNESLSEMNDINMFVTFFCGVLDLKGGHLSYCNAGHNPPFILTDSIEALPVVPNLPLGVQPGMNFVEQETALRYDDALFLYTDGLTEAENAEHKQFGEMRVKAALRGKKSSEAHLSTIEGKVSEFVGEAPQSDDLTMLFIHYLGTGGGNPHHLTLHNDIKQLSLLQGFIETVADEVKIGPAETASLNLALEEAVTNVIMYAYPEGTDGLVDIDVHAGEGSLSFVISDGGKAFDPTAKGEVDVSASVEQRQIGGLGIHLIRQIMDEVKYERKEDKNYLILTKKI